MAHAYGHIIDDCSMAPAVAVDPVRGRDGLWGVSLVADGKYYFVPRKDDWDEFVSDLLGRTGQLGCWDVRRLLDWPLRDDKVVWDVRSLYGGTTALPAAARQHLADLPLCSRYLEADAKMAAHARALKTTQIPIAVPQAVPIELLRSWMRDRTAVIHTLLRRSGRLEENLAADYESRWPFVRALREIELNGIHVDLGLAERELRGSPDPATGSCLRSMQVLARDGMVTALYNPMGGKTGRCRPEGGFNAMAVPKGTARHAITSRYEGGLICSFDFNASDYRCIVRAVGGEVAELYRGARDFHERTTSFVFKEVNPKRRDSIKYLSYIYIYGGSEETLVTKTGWTMEQVRAVLELLDRKIAPVKTFREQLWMEAQEQGFVEVPGGRRVKVAEDDNAGKVIGLFAQSYSSYIFEQAVVRVQRLLRGKQSKIIMLVHDELVLDAHPDELDMLEEIREAMQQDGHVVKIKKGRSYGEQAE